MQINLELTTAEEYFDKVGKKIDWEGTGNPNLISGAETGAITAILSIEVSIHVMRRCTGTVDGVNIDTMVTIRRSFINMYEKAHNKKYIEYRDFY